MYGMEVYICNVQRHSFRGGAYITVPKRPEEW